VWTPKRILLLAGGLVVSLAGYVVYAFALGSIDGLPPLPEAYLPSTVVSMPQGKIENPRDRKLIQAFGAGCPELNWPFKIDASQRGLVLAFEDYTIEEDGRVRLHPFSIALFKDKHDGSYPEINTIRSPEAYLRFDQPIHELQEISRHRIVGAELREVVTLVNNRRTPLKSDDLEVRITTAPVFFDEKEGRVWTESFVDLIDTQTQPEPTEIKAKGLKMYLTREDPSKKPASKTAAKSPAQAHHPGRGAGTNISGVDTVVLQSDVEMHLLVDAEAGFPGGGEKKQTRTSAKKPAEKSRVVIRTPGAFTYDVPRDHAVFESPSPGKGKGGPLATPPQVSVSREHLHNGKMYDQLICGRLELQFRRKPAAALPPSSDNNAGADREIESARATARPGEEVKLAMDTENLDAHGEEFIYYAATPTKGPETILRGSAAHPMWAVKDAHVITARELHLFGADRNGEGQHGVATGPGQIDLLDTKNGTNTVHQYHALWQDKLVVTKDREEAQVFDLLTFTGKAAFIDDEHHQEMHGDKLQVWLEPPPREGPPPGPDNKKQPAPGAPQQRPHKVEAFDHVRVASPELNVQQCEHLIVRFKDGPAGQLPAALPASPKAAAAKAPAPSGTASAAAPKTATAASANAPGSPPAAAPTKKTDSDRKPINLWARRVTAYVLRFGSKHELHEVATEGNVHVHQDGAKPEDKGVDIRGEVLNLTCEPQGDILVVFGDARGPAQLQLGDLLLAGPKVTINQKLNMVEVDGQGAMRLPSNTALDGGPAKKDKSYLTIYWTKDMFFDGKVADFRGGVEGQQEGGSLLCQTLQATLDRVVSFKEGQKGGQAAKVQDLVCDRKVYVVNLTRDAKGQFLRYDRVQGTQLSTNNQQGPTIVEGPGTIISYQKGTPDGTLTPGKSAAPPVPTKPGSKQEFYLTRVDFKGRVHSKVNPDVPAAKDKVRITKFFDNVQVYHGPADGPDAKFDLNHLPKGALYLKCEQMTITSKTLPDGKTVQWMQAERNVYFYTKEFNGQAPLVRYDQSTDIAFFIGGPGNLVTLNQFVGPPGTPPRQIMAEEIRYDRRTGEFQVTKGHQLSSSSN
jgi:hypothetical protein